LIDNLENETDVTEVTAVLKNQKSMLFDIFTINTYTPSKNEKDSRANDISLDHAVITFNVVNVLVRKRGSYHSYQFVIGLVAKLGVHKKDVKLLLEGLAKVVLHNLYFHILRDLLVEDVLS